MKRQFLCVFILTLIIVILSFSLLGCASLNSEKDPNLIFEDNFDGNTFNLSKWKFLSHDKYRRRGCYYDADNIIVKNGTLTIRTNYKDGKYGEGWYTAWLETSIEQHQKDATPKYNGFNTTYGYFEISCKTDYMVGAWSAFWLMPDDDLAWSMHDVQDTTSDGAEFDIMESNWIKNFTGHVIHYDGYDERLKSKNSGPVFVKNMYTEFNTYAFEWTPTEYIFYINGEETWKVDDIGICEVPLYMIISHEVGGYFTDEEMVPGFEKDGSVHWTGNVNNANQIGRDFDFVIDYIRVYKTNPYKITQA